MLKELLIGFILAFLVSIPFSIAHSSGNLIDTTRGTASLQVTDPTTRTTTGPVGILYNYMLIAIFFCIGGPIIFMDGLAKSFLLIPVDHFLNPIFFSSYHLPFWQLIIGLLDHVLKMALQLGAPSIIGVLMAEMFLGIANRLAPQVQIVFLGISLKSWVGLGLLGAAWFFVLKQLGTESILWLQVLDNTVKQIAY
jgi:type III secretory pathway component EscT